MKELEEYRLDLLKQILSAVNNEDNKRELKDFNSFGVM